MLKHRDEQITRFELGLSEIGRDSIRLMGLLKERLSRVVLPSPVISMGLMVRDVQALPEPTRDLFGTPATAREKA